MKDADGPWTAAAFADDDPAFERDQHGVEGAQTLCGLSESSVIVVRNAFYGTGVNDCPDCARRLRELASE